MISSMSSNILRIDLRFGCAEERSMEEIFVSAAESEREKTKDRIRVYVGDERKRS